MTHDELYERLLQSSFRFVSFRPRSVSEIRQFLRKKLQKSDIPEKDSLIDRVIVRLAEYGYADDAAFAAWWVEQRHAHRPKGERLVRHELKTKGIQEGDIDRAMRELGDEHEGTSQYEQAMRACAKKIDSWAKLPELDMKRKAFGFLQRRGFSAETAAKIIDDIRKNRYNTANRD